MPGLMCVEQCLYLIVQEPGSRQVVAVFTDFQACIGKDLVVVGPGWIWQVDDLVWVVCSQEFAANLTTPEKVVRLTAYCG